MDYVSGDECQLHSSLESPLNQSASNIPFSLQETCLLYLVGHLDKYTTDTLSLLPLHLRHQLLCRLSAYDLTTLENTPVTKGLDESSYWKALLAYVKRVLYPKCDVARCYNCLIREMFVPREDLEPKELFLRIAAHHIQIPYSLKNYALQIVRFCSWKCPTEISLPRAKLFCLPNQFPTSQIDDITVQYIQATLQLSGLSYVDVSLGLVIPSRLPATSSLVDPWDNLSRDCALSLIKLLVDHFGYHCHHLPLDKKVYSMFGGNKHQWTIVERYLSHAELMHFSGLSCDVFRSIPKGWENILQKNFCTENTRLTKVHLNYCFREKLFKKGIKFLSQQLGYSTRSVDLPRYSGLKEIVILNYVHDSKKLLKSSSHPLYKLAVIIEGQDQLKILRLQGSFQATPHCHALMMAIAKSFQKSALEELEISCSRNSQMNATSLSQVLRSYLFTPSAGDQVVKLYGSNNIREVTNKEKKMIDEHFGEHSRAFAIQDQSKKSLVLSTEQLPCLLPIFSRMPIQVTLKKIELVICGPPERQSYLPNVAAHSVILNFTDADILHHPTSRYTTDEVGATGYTLILNNHIKHLSVLSTSLLIPKSYFSSLGMILAKHAERYQTLQSITIINGSMKADMDQCDLTLCESLVSLAQVVPLELKLENMDHFLSMLHKVWKEKAVRKFHRLSIPEISVELRNMVEEVELYKLAKPLIFTCN